MLSPNTMLQNRYLILQPIGRGGMGTVYEATDTRLKSTVALKQTHLTDAASLRAFEREAHLLARLRHTALPKVIDHFSEETGQFLVMEYIAGDDLATLMEKRGGHFPLASVTPWVLRWADQLLDALDYLHSQSPPIIHRDIKPQNLKLSARGDIILLDFGLAKGGLNEASTLTARGDKVLGFTPNYAPLEQIRGGDPDPRSDFYSLGATLYHLLTGEKPPDALTRVAALLNDQPDPLQSASELNAHVTPVVAAVIQRALAASADERPATAAEMRRELREARLHRTGDTVTQPTPVGVAATPVMQVPQRTANTNIILASGNATDTATRHLSPAEMAPDQPEVGTLVKTLFTGSAVLCLAMSPDEQLVAAGCDDGTLGLWKLEDDTPLHTLEGHASGVSGMAFSPDGTLLASGSDDSTVCLWRVEDGALLHKYEHSDPIESVAYSPDGQWVVLGGWGGAVSLCQVRDNQIHATFDLPTGFVHSVAFSPDGTLLAAGCYDTTIRLWRMSDREPVRTLSGHSNYVLTVAFSANGKTLASGGGGTDVNLWRVADGRLLDTWEGHTNFVRSLAFNADNSILASGSEDRTVRLWRASDGSPVHTIDRHNDGVTSLAFCGGGSMLLSGSRDTKVRLWQVG